MTVSGKVSSAAHVSAIADPSNWWGVKNRYAQVIASTTVMGSTVTKVSTRCGVAFHAMTDPTTATTTKLYGQISPTNHGGGCQAGLSMVAYHDVPVDTQMPEPTT